MKQRTNRRCRACGGNLPRVYGVCETEYCSGCRKKFANAVAGNNLNNRCVINERKKGS